MENIAFKIALTVILTIAFNHNSTHYTGRKLPMSTRNDFESTHQNALDGNNFEETEAREVSFHLSSNTCHSMLR